MKREATVRILDEKTDTVIKVWKDLLERYRELEQVGEWATSRPRVVVLGEAETRPDEVFAALFGEPVATARHDRAEQPPWEVYATFGVDNLPGGGVVGAEGSEEQALTYLREADALLLCTLHDRRPTELEQGLFEHVRRLRRVQAVLVVTPLDTPAALASEEPTRDRDAEREAWTAWELELRRVLNDREVACFPVRRLRSDHLVPIARYLCTKLDSRFQLGFASMVLHQSSRDALVVDLINSLSRTAAFLGLNPIPYADLIAITPVQVLMVCRIAAAYGRRISVRWAADFVAVCAAVAGTGLGFKMLYRRIKKGLGNPGLPLLMPLGAGVAWVGTQVIGHAARLYFQSSGGMSARQAGRKAAQLVAEQSVVGMLLVQ